MARQLALCCSRCGGVTANDFCPRCDGERWRDLLEAMGEDVDDLFAHLTDRCRPTEDVPANPYL